MVTYASVSKSGDRNNNEDFTGIYNNEGLFFFALADGLGGHGRGEVASRIAVEKAIESIIADSKNLGNCFQIGQDTILEEQALQNSGNEMKTTLTCLRIISSRAQWGHIGDSRIYRFRNNKFIARTLDHSVPQMLVATGEIKEKDIRHHEDRNRLTRVMGMEWSSPRYEISDEMPLTGSDAFLLCSDGFWELITEKEMTAFLKKAKSPQEWLDRMETVVLTNGKGKNMDNYSAIAVFVR